MAVKSNRGARLRMFGQRSHGLPRDAGILAAAILQHGVILTPDN